MFTNALISCRVNGCSLTFDFQKPKVLRIVVIDDTTEQQFSQEIPIEDINDSVVGKAVKYGIYKAKAAPPDL